MKNLMAMLMVLTCILQASNGYAEKYFKLGVGPYTPENEGLIENSAAFSYIAFGTSVSKKSKGNGLLIEVSAGNYIADIKSSGASGAYESTPVLLSGLYAYNLKNLPFGFFGGVGVGPYFVRTRSSLGAENSEVKFGVNAKGGVRAILFKKFALSLESNYSVVSGENGGEAVSVGIAYLF